MGKKAKINVILMANKQILVTYENIRVQKYYMIRSSMVPRLELPQPSYRLINFSWNAFLKDFAEAPNNKDVCTLYIHLLTITSWHIKAAV